jgi:hypothetical protein
LLLQQRGKESRGERAPDTGGRLNDPVCAGTTIKTPRHLNQFAGEVSDYAKGPTKAASDRTPGKICGGGERSAQGGGALHQHGPLRGRRRAETDNEVISYPRRVDPISLSANPLSKAVNCTVSLDQAQTFWVSHGFHPLHGRELTFVDQYLAQGKTASAFAMIWVPRWCPGYLPHGN